MRGLYAIVDIASAKAHGYEPVAFASAVLKARPVALQLRAKDSPPREVLATLRALLPLCRRAGVRLVANDRPDLAALAGCDMVHVGQDDMPIEQVRRLAPSLGVGISTHTVEQLRRALQCRPDYVAFGPVFATTSKVNPDPVVGIEGLAQAAALVEGTGVPLVAIGGVTLERARDVAVFSDAAATIAGLYPPGASELGRVASHASALHEALGGRPVLFTGVEARI